MCQLVFQINHKKFQYFTRPKADFFWRRPSSPGGGLFGAVSGREREGDNTAAVSAPGAPTKPDPLLRPFTRQDRPFPGGFGAGAGKEA
jgi:hypothetical protein